MKITQAFTFEAAHHLPQVSQEHLCHQIHGHSYKVELTLEGPVDSKTGFVIDFFDVESAVAPIIRLLDHTLLNKVEDLDNPTAENIAVWIWQRIHTTLPLLK